MPLSRDMNRFRSVGAESVSELLGHLHRYALQTYRIAGGEAAESNDGSDYLDLVLLGVHSQRAPTLLAALSSMEDDEAWRVDLLAATADWAGRILGVNLQIHQAEVEDLIQRTGGSILEHWEVRNPRAYEHYQRSERLQAQGRLDDAIAEVAKAVGTRPPGSGEPFHPRFLPRRHWQGDERRWARAPGNGILLARARPGSLLDRPMDRNRVPTYPPRQRG